MMLYQNLLVHFNSRSPLMMQLGQGLCKQAGNGFGTAPREALTPISTVEPPHQELCCSTDNILRLEDPTAVFDVTAAMPEM